MFLTNVDFARLNWKIQNFMEQNPNLTEQKIKENLETCLSFRKKLYSKVGLKEVIVMCDMHNAHTKYFDKHTINKNLETFNKDKIEKIAEEYNSFVKIIWDRIIKKKEF